MEPILDIDIIRHSQFSNFEIELPDGGPTTVTIWEDGDVVFNREDKCLGTISILVHKDLLKEISQAAEIFCILRSSKNA
jgi:hypothetical protein